MDGARDALFATAGFAADEHWHLQDRQLLYVVPDLFQHIAATEHAQPIAERQRFLTDTEHRQHAVA